jgi:hypothetical protein
MPKIVFPPQLEELLTGSSLYSPICTLANRVDEILAGSTLPFFLDYTDHGVEHVNCVLNSEVELVPDAVWESSKQGSAACVSSVVETALASPSK